MLYRASFLAERIKMQCQKYGLCRLKVWQYTYVYIEFVHKGVTLLTKSHSMYWLFISIV